MMELLKRFAALSLVSGLMLSLLPEGSMRRTASMAAGLLMLLCWTDSISSLLKDFSLLPAGSTPASLLTATGVTLDSAWESAALTMQERMEGMP